MTNKNIPPNFNHNFTNCAFSGIQYRFEENKKCKTLASGVFRHYICQYIHLIPNYYVSKQSNSNRKCW